MSESLGPAEQSNEGKLQGRIGLCAAFAALLASFSYLIRMIACLPLNIDEIEHLHATYWVSQGLVPYRGFWEHHTPLHWEVMAPLASAVGLSSVPSFLVMRFINQAWTFGLIALLLVWAGRRGASRPLSILIMALFFGAPLFTRYVAEYRPDALMNLLFFGGLFLLEKALEGGRRASWLRFFAGLAFGLACLSSQRMVPIVLVATAFYFLVAADERWGFQWRSIFTVLGGVVVSAAVVGYFWWHHALAAFFKDNVTMNILFEQGADRNPYGSFWYLMVATPIRTMDFAYLLMVLLGASGFLAALPSLRRATWSTRLVVLVGFETIFLCLHSTKVSYLFQSLWWLLFLLACETLPRLLPNKLWDRSRWVALLSVVVAGLALLSHSSRPWAYWESVQTHQDHTIREVEAVTSPGDCVWDGTGYIFDRPPAFRYWFFPRGVRCLTGAKRLEPFDQKALVQRKPAAIIMDYRLGSYVKDLGGGLDQFIGRNYLPLDTAVWIPAPNALLTASDPSFAWTVLKGGTYRVVVAPAMAKSKWFKQPLFFAYLEYFDFVRHDRDSQRYRIDTRHLSQPSAEDAVRIFVDGREGSLSPGGTLVLRAGQRLEVSSGSGKELPILFAPVNHPIYFNVPFPFVVQDLGLELLYPDQVN